jgi:hypothetical protein
MSLTGFQNALVELTLAPWDARALRLGELAVLDAYDLSPRERARLRDLVSQPGMSINCSLSRGGRLEVIFDVFPMTCHLARPVLRELLEAHCQRHRPSSYQLSDEPAGFAAVVRDEIAAGTLAIAYLDEIFAYELLCRELSVRDEPSGETEALFRFNHPPDALLTPLSRLEPPPPDLTAGHFPVRVRFRGGRYQVEPI